MIPFWVMLAAILLARIAGALGVEPLTSWRSATRVGLAVMFVFTGVAHINRLRADLVRMVPRSLPNAPALVTVTGILELAGATGLLVEPMARWAGVGLILLLIVLFPANVHAARAGLTLGGRPVTPIPVRLPLQLLWIGLLGWSAAWTGAGPERRFDKGVFTSSEYPAISIRFDEALRYIGAARTELDGGAIVDRHHLVDATPDGRIKSLFVLHFETQPPGPDHRYRYKIPQGEDAAGRDYIHNTWVFDAKTSVEENPTKELAATAALLEREGLTLPDELHMSRFVRVVDEEAKRELILFYLEPLDPREPHVADFLDGRVAQDVFDALSDGITARSRKAFQVVAG